MLRRIIIIFLFCLYLIEGRTQTLDNFIKSGLQNSPLLKDYQNQISSFSIDSLMIKASQKPQINGNAQALYSPSYNNFGYDEAITNGGNYSALAGISQPFLNRKTLENKYDNTRIQKLSVGNTLKISVNDLKRLITNQYITAYSDYSDLSFNNSFLKLMHDEDGILKQLVENGLYKQTDYLSFLIETQSQEMLVKQLNTQLKKEINLLNQICGIADSGNYEINYPELTKQLPANPQSSPLFMQFKIDSLKITNQKNAVDIRYKPKFNWIADAGLLSSTPENLYRHFGYSAGINFSMSIYDGEQRKLDYQKLSILENTRNNYEIFFKRQYNQQLKQMNEELNSISEMRVQLNKQLKTAENLIAIEKAEMNTGNISITDYINAKKNYININRSLNQIKIRELQIINDWNYLMQK
ncbi:MAG: TolC family protein [Bacteroidota bacterium]|nr:TolC family protein [Bacteroidota bacterium]